MTSRQRTLAAIAGLPHDRVPVIQHNFPFCVRQAGIAMEEYRQDPKLAAKVLADAAYTYGYDCIIIDFDTCTLAEALGAELEFPRDGMATVKTPPLESVAQMADLKVPSPFKDGRMPLWLETTRELRRIVGDDKAIMGRADQGPFGLLFQLRGHENFMMDVIDAEEDVLHMALARCTEIGVQFAKAQLDAGSDITSIGDSASGESLISPRHYAQFAQPYQKAYKQALGNGLLSLHICGKTNSIIEGMVQTGSDVLELDHENVLATSLTAVDSRAAVFGNIDPSSVLSQGSEEDVLRASREVLSFAVPQYLRFGLCPGCVANADVPPENICAMTKAAEQWGCYR